MDGIVVDKAYLLQFFLKLCTLFVTGVGYLLSFRGGGTIGCQLVASQRALSQAVVEQFNDTFTYYYYNVTIGRGH